MWIYIPIIITLGIFSYCENNLITISEHILKFDNLPGNFNGTKILQISDLHSKYFGKNQRILVRKIDEINPDIIVFTGDMSDSRRYNEKPALDLIAELEDKYKLYFVTGNHEARSGKWKHFENNLRKYNIELLQNKCVKYYKKDSHKNDYIKICGIYDNSYSGLPNSSVTHEELKLISKSINNKEFKILLSHRPEYFQMYGESRVNLVFCGHAHGGQVRLPVIGGVIAPNQGFNPKYYEGVYEEGNTKMVVSRGLGNSRCPQRLFNHPELVVVILTSK